MHVAHRVQELSRLRLERGHDARVAVPDVGDAERRGEIDVAIAIDVPYVRTRRALPEYRPAVGHEGDIAGFVTAKLAGQGAGLRAGDSGLPRWQQIVHNDGITLAVLDEAVVGVARLLVDEQHEVVESHRLQQVIDADGLVIRLVRRVRLVAPNSTVTSASVFRRRAGVPRRSSIQCRI